jgi:hypothetical protein
MMIGVYLFLVYRVVAPGIVAANGSLTSLLLVGKEVSRRRARGGKEAYKDEPSIQGKKD